MRHAYRIALTVGVLAAVALLLRPGRAQDGAAAPAVPTRVAVCDVAQVVNSCESVRIASQQMTQHLQDLRKDDRRRQGELDELRKELGEYTAGSEPYEKVLARMEKLTVERNVWLELEKKKAERQRTRLTRQTYERIRAAAAAVARQRGFDIVLSVDRGDLVGESSPELVNDMARRNVLYAAEQVDITEAVLTRLNQAPAGDS